jgi:cyanophycinase
MKLLLTAVAVMAFAGQAAPGRLVTAERPPAQTSTTHGPSRGSLVLQGGVGSNPAITSAFIALAGGPSSHIVVIPTASVGDAGPAGDWESRLAVRLKDSWGVAAVDVLQSLDRDRSNSDRFVEPLRKATGLWILGGFPRNLVHSYLGTKTETAIRDLLARGGVVGGESAGAMIQASWLDTSDDEDFTPDDRSLIKANGRAGFNLLTGAAVFPHFDSRGPDAALKFSREHPDQLGIGIDEETALVVKGDHAEVVGLRTVSLYDGRRPGAASPVVLHSGDRYDFSPRK